MDFGIIDTTPSHGFKSPAFTALRTYTQHQRDASALTLLPGGRKQSTASRHSHRVRLVLILDFGFWAARAAARRTHFTSSAQPHVNQKSFDMTTPNDNSRASQQIPHAHIVRAPRER